MLGGGFDQVVIAKNGRMTFQETEIDGQEVWEQLTPRRQIPSAETVKSQIPMFPTVELMRQIQKPRFEPLTSVNNKMFLIGV